jgi:hypothetical protein
MSLGVGRGVKERSLSFPAVGRRRLLNSVLTVISKLRLNSSLQPLRARGLLVATVCKFFFGGGCCNYGFVWYYSIICLSLLQPHLVLLYG